MELARRCHFREDHGTHVARLALSLFHQTRRLHKLTDGDAELLEYAALLHDIGFYISPHRHHRHTEYLIKSHAMTGFSKSEVQTIALTARHHRKAEPRYGRGTAKSLSKSEARRVRYLAAILRVADALDRTHARLVRAVRCSISPRTVEVRVDADGDPELELWAARPQRRSVRGAGRPKAAHRRRRHLAIAKRRLSCPRPKRRPRRPCA